MKNTIKFCIKIGIICLLPVFLCVGCNKTNNKSAYFTVNFDSTGGGSVQAQVLEKGSYVVMPVAPEKSSTSSNVYNFAGWYVDGRKWDFEKDVVNEDVTLIAKWIIEDYTIGYQHREIY